MTVLVTGGAGYIGSHMVCELADSAIRSATIATTRSIRAR